jgi:hypothetical protein
VAIGEDGVRGSHCGGLVGGEGHQRQVKGVLG